METNSAGKGPPSKLGRSGSPRISIPISRAYFRTRPFVAGSLEGRPCFALGRHARRRQASRDRLQSATNSSLGFHQGIPSGVHAHDRSATVILLGSTSSPLPTPARHLPACPPPAHLQLIVAWIHASALVQEPARALAAVVCERFVVERVRDIESLQGQHRCQHGIGAELIDG